MKLIVRLLLTLPFSIVTFFYLKSNLAEEGCSGLIDLMVGLIFLILFIVSIFLAYKGCSNKHKLNNKRNFEPLTFSIIVITFIILLIGRIFGNRFKGEIWMSANSYQKNYYLENQELLLRKNGTFVITSIGADVSCFHSGKYINQFDTIILDKQTVEKVNNVITQKYFITSDTLQPIYDTTITKNRYSYFIMQRRE